ncbi:hypothetical protein lbkm_3907 [Lachnospiraceae bacterium KM106-2]|nr:hypothetical protein lbkm_3907 [Lachnospiraceae bacterium KM106-2]
MKLSRKNIVFLFVVLCGFALTIFTYHNEAYYSTTIAKVIKVENENMTPTKVKQNLVGKILNGKEKGKEIKLKNQYSKSLVYDEKYKENDRLFVSILSKQQGELEGRIVGVKRDYMTILVIVVFILMLCFIGGKKGYLSLLSLGINVGVFYFALQFYEKGTSILELGIIMVLVFSILSLVIVSGRNKKMLAALLSTLLTIVVIGLLSAIVLFHYRDLDYEFLEYLVKPYRYYDAVLLFLVELLIGGLGAIMDISITMSATVHELVRQKADLGWSELFESCREVGYDIMGTMLSVMFFTNLSGCIPFFALAMRNNIQIGTLTHYYIPFEAVRFLTTGIGIVLAIPIAAYISIGIGTRRWRP